VDATRALALDGPTGGPLRKAAAWILGILAVGVPLLSIATAASPRAPASARMESLAVTGSNTGALPLAAGSLPTVVDALGYQPRSLVAVGRPSG
jgi:hypothetical protein